MIKFRKGQRVTVKVGGKEYITVIDKQGVQRFIADNVLVYLVDSGQIDLNKMSIDYQNKKVISKREYAEFNMKIGYSVCGFADLHLFKSYKIENPVWDSNMN